VRRIPPRTPAGRGLPLERARETRWRFPRRSELTGARRACLFLGMLEMARDQLVTIEQNEEFGAIWVTAPCYHKRINA